MGFNDDWTRSARAALCAYADTFNFLPQELQNGAYRNLVCDLPTPGTGQLVGGEPGLGGQCPGVTYQINTEVTTQFNFGAVNTIEVPTNLVGPISAARIQGSGVTSQAVIDHAGTTTVVSEETFENRTITDFKILSITRADGLPDNCGNLVDPVPPEYQDTIPDPDGGPDIDITIRPGPFIILPFGGVSFPFTIEGPNFNFDYEFTYGDGSCCQNEPRPRLPGGNPLSEPIGNESIPEVGENEPPPEGGPTDIIGCIVTVTSRNNAPATVLGGTTGFPELLIPRIAVISFAVRVEGQAAWTADIPVKFDKQWVPVPGRLLAYDVRIKPEGGVNALYFPLRVTKEFKEKAGLL